MDVVRSAPCAHYIPTPCVTHITNFSYLLVGEGAYSERSISISEHIVPLCFINAAYNRKEEMGVILTFCRRIKRNHTTAQVHYLLENVLAVAQGLFLRELNASIGEVHHHGI